MDFLRIYLQTKSNGCIRDILNAIIYFSERYIKDCIAMFFLGFFLY